MRGIVVKSCVLSDEMKVWYWKLWIRDFQLFGLDDEDWNLIDAFWDLTRKVNVLFQTFDNLSSSGEISIVPNKISVFWYFDQLMHKFG